MRREVVRDLEARASRSGSAVALARELARTTLGPQAARVDEAGELGRPGMEELARSGLLGFFVPPELGGLGGTYAELARVAAELARGCLPTAMNWVMHAHQALVLSAHGGEAARPWLRRVAAEGAWIASVTTEHETGGSLVEVLAPLAEEEGGLRVRRRSPHVSYGDLARLFLVTMRRSATASPRDVRLVLVARDDGDVRVEGEWRAMGMRGTASVPMSFDVRVERERMLPDPFQEIAVRSMVPAAHVGWSAAWLAAAQEGLRVAVERLRETRSEHVLHRLGELRLALDLGQALLQRVTAELDGALAAGAPTAAYEEVGLHLRLNGLKVAGARIAFEVVDGLVQLCGLRDGYLQGEGALLERLFRDLRSASLMLNDDRLLVLAGRLVLTEESGLGRPLGRS